MKNHNGLMSKVAGVALAAMMSPALMAGLALAQEDTLPPTGPDARSEQSEPASASPATQTGTLSTSWGVAVDPLVPVELIAGLGGLYGAFCLYAASRRMRGSWLRAGAGGVLALALLNPEILQEQRENLPTQIAVVVDKSESQKLDGRDILTQAAYDDLAARFGGIENIEIRVIEIDQSQDGQVRDGTQLFTALNAGLSDISPDRLGAVILLTDGQVHDITQSTLPGTDVPLHVLLSGHEGEIDRHIVVERAPTYGMVDQEQIISFRLLDDGAASSLEPITVTVRANGEVLQTLSVRAGDLTELALTVPQTGENIIELEAQALPGELTEINNKNVLTIEGVRDNMRVLMISGEPNVEERAWRDLLKSDPSVDLVHFTILRPPHIVDDTSLDELSLIALPTREVFTEKLQDFDLVIFDHYQHSGLIPTPYLTAIADYVKEGGALMVMTGPDYASGRSLYNTPLASVLPVAPTENVLNRSYIPELTTDGQRHPVTRNLDGTGADNPVWGRWLRMVDATATSGNVVMEGAGDNPLLVLDHVDQGRVAMLMTDTSWLWAKGYDGGGPHSTLVRRLSHWLMQEPDLDEEALRMYVQDGDLVIERQTLSDETTPVTLTSPSGVVQTVTLNPDGPGIWRATVNADELGLYQGAQEDEIALANVGVGNPKEFADTRSTPDILGPVVAETGGFIARMSDGNGNLALPRIVPVTSAEVGRALSGADWMGLQMRNVSDLKSVDRWSPLGGWIGFGLIVGLLAAMWYREGDGAWLRREKWQKLFTPTKKDPAPTPDGQ